MSASEGPLLEARGLRKAFGGNVVLDDVNLQFRPGASRPHRAQRAGKTTCFNILTASGPGSG
jgi:ABC-type branched-subunit amino acid transport system ATPase component